MNIKRKKCIRDTVMIVVSLLMVAFIIFLLIMAFRVFQTKRYDNWIEEVYTNGPWGTQAIWVATDNDIYFVCKEEQKLIDPIVYVNIDGQWIITEFSVKAGGQKAIFETEDNTLIVEGELSVGKGQMVISNVKESGQMPFLNGRSTLTIIKYDYDDKINQLPFLTEDFFNKFYNSDSDTKYEDLIISLFTNHCLISLYDIPEEVDLYELFYNGFGVAVEEEDKSFLEEQGAYSDGDIIKLPREQMDSVLMHYFDIILPETKQIGIEKFYYNAEKDIYYLVHGDTNSIYINLLRQYLDENGDLKIVYSIEDSIDPNEKRIAVLKKKEDKFVFQSNQLHSEYWNVK